MRETINSSIIKDIPQVSIQPLTKANVVEGKVPFITTSYQQQLLEICKRTKSSFDALKAVPSFKRIVQQKELEALKNIDLLSTSILNGKHNALELQNCMRELQDFKQTLTRAGDKNKEIGKAVEGITNEIDQLEALFAEWKKESTILNEYQIKLQPLNQAGIQFFTQCDRNPLSLLSNVGDFVTQLQQFDLLITHWPKAKDSSKLSEIQQLQMKSFAEELESSIHKFEKELGQLLKVLQFHLLRSNQGEKSKAAAIASALRKQLQVSIQNLPSNLGEKWLPSKQHLEQVLSSSSKTIDSWGLPPAAQPELQFNSDGWHQTLSSLPPMPKGLFRFQFSPKFLIPAVLSLSALCLGILYMNASSPPKPEPDVTPSLPPEPIIPPEPVIIPPEPVDIPPEPPIIIDEFIKEEIKERIQDQVLPVINGLGVIEDFLADQCNDKSIEKIKIRNFKQTVNNSQALEEIKQHFNEETCLDLRNQHGELLNELNSILSDFPTRFCSLEETVDWTQAVEQNRTKIELLGRKLVIEPKLEVQDEQVRQKENLHLIQETLKQPATVPSDWLYTNLVALYRPNLAGAKIGNNDLEGIPLYDAIEFVLGTQRAYQKALQAYPDYSSSCRKEPCSAIFSSANLPHHMEKDAIALQNVIEKVEFGQKLFQSSPAVKNKLMAEKFASLPLGSSFLLPVIWDARASGSAEGHAIVLEVEKDFSEKILLRVFNLGAGVDLHAQSLSGYEAIPFSEVTGVDPKRFFGGALTGFLDTISRLADPNIHMGQWDFTSAYDVALGSLGGQITARADSPALLREKQMFFGNCAMVSLFAALDKSFVSAALSERMRALTLYRATKSYYEENLTRLTNHPESEARRQLIIMGTKATMEAVERALEVGGILDVGANELLKGTRSIFEFVKKLQADDLGLLANAAVGFNGYQEWKIAAPQVDHSRLHSIATTQFIPKKSPQAPTSEMAPALTVLTQPAGFSPPPLKDPAFAALMGYAEKQKDKNLGMNRALMLTPLEQDEVFQLGFQDARSFTAVTQSKTLKITDQIALLSQNVADFLDGDRLQVLQGWLLDSVVLKKNLASDPGLVRAIAKFCRNGRQIGYLIQSAETESYFAYLSRTIEQAFQALGASEGVNKQDFQDLPDSHTVFKQLIADADPEVEKERLKVIHLYRVKSFEMHTRLSQQEAAELLASINYLKTEGFPANIQLDGSNELNRLSELQKVALEHLDTAESIDPILNYVAFDLDRYHSPCKFSWYPQEQLYINAEKSIYYDPQACILKKQNLGKQQPPEVLLNDPLVKAIMGNDERPLEVMKKNVYLYNDEKGNHYRFIMQDTNGQTQILVQRQFKQVWHQAFDITGVQLLPSYPNPLNNANWHENGILWVSHESEKSYYYSGFDGQPMLQFVPLDAKQNVMGQVHSLLSGKNLRAELVNTDTGLMLVDPARTALSKLLGRMEDLSYTFSFSKEGKLQQISLPRLGLKFKASGEKKADTPDLLTCKQLDGFGIFAGAQSLRLFGDFPHYLPLKKIGKEGREELGVLLPYLPLAQQNNGVLTSPTAFEPVPEGWTQRIPWFFYRIKHGELMPDAATPTDAVQANLHLAVLFLSERKYEEAAKYLNAADRLLKGMGEQVEEKIGASLLNIVSFAAYNIDTIPDAAAVRLRAGAIYQRLVDLGQVDPVPMPCLVSLEDTIEIDAAKPYFHDFINYRLHRNQVSAVLRLSDEEDQMISKFLNGGHPGVSSAYTFPVPQQKEGLIHPRIAISSKNGKAAVSEDLFDSQTVAFPTQDQSAGRVATTRLPIFLEAFPDKILHVYTLLRNPQDIGLSQKVKIAQQFGLDSQIPVQDLKLTMHTLLELRYRYLANRLINSEDLDTLLTPDQLDKLKLEINLLGALIRVSNGEKPDERDLEAAQENFKEFAATIRTIPGYQNQIMQEYLPILNHLEGRARTEAIWLWNELIAPKSLPLLLSIERAKTVTPTFVGPAPTAPLLKLENGKFPAAQQGTVQRPALIHYTALPIAPSELENCFSTKVTDIELAPSPYQLALDKTPKFIADIFRQRDAQYKQYLAGLPTKKTHYTLKEREGKERLEKLVDTTKKETIKIRSRTLILKREIEKRINRLPEEKSLRAHTGLRKARGAIRELTIEDAKTALAKGWDVDHLHRLNPHLSLKEINEIFEGTMEQMLETREMQRRDRLVKSIEKVLGPASSEHAKQLMIESMMKSAKEKMEYDPYDHPLLLLVETEYDISLWPEQIPGILRLAPVDQVAALVELAMGLGKTDVVSPPVLCLLADGKTLPILVMPDALVPVAAQRLQQRMGQGFDREIRVIPINRGDWTLQKINSLKEEFSNLIQQRIPVVWASTDIQTLINSYFEEMNEMRKNPPPEASEKINAWKELFLLLRKSAVILGDEIHSIFDILTSYNFSLGTPKLLSDDEMDGVADFLTVVAQHPDVAGKVALPFAGRKGTIPLTEEYFQQNLAPKIIETFLDRGIINAPESRELFQKMEPKKKQAVIEYLSSSSSQPKEFDKIELMPLLDQNAIQGLEKGTLGIGDKGVQNILQQQLLPSDRVVIAALSKKEIPEALKLLDEKYKRLDQRMRNFLAVQKEGLRLVFAHTASLQLGKHYVLNKEETSAIPAEEGTPLWDAQFGSSIERLFLTSFLFSQRKLDKETIRMDLDLFVEKYRKRIVEVTNDLLQQGELSPNFLDDPLKQAFEKRYGTLCTLKQRGFTDLEVDQLTDWINEKIERQLPLIRDHLFTKQKVYPEEIRVQHTLYSSYF